MFICYSEPSIPGIQQDDEEGSDEGAPTPDEDRKKGTVLNNYLHELLSDNNYISL